MILEVEKLGRRVVRAARLEIKDEALAREVQALGPDDRVRLVWFVNGAKFADREPCLSSLIGLEGASSSLESPVSEPQLSLKPVKVEDRPRIDWGQFWTNIAVSLILVLTIKVIAGDQDANRDPRAGFENAETLRAVSR